jgi:enoyl-[acyl-carrier protein] reductase III
MARALAGKVALVTGAARGIGRAIATKLATRRLRRRGQLLQQRRRSRSAVRSISRGMAGARVAIAGSVGDPDSVDEMFAEFGTHFDRLDIWCRMPRAACSSRRGHDAEALGAGASKRMRLALNLLTQRALPLMKDGGRVIAMSSLGAQRAMPGYGFIGASKAALEALARALAQELGPRGIRVNVVSAASSTPTRCVFSEPRGAAGRLCAAHACRAGADAAGRRRRGLPAVPAGSRR